MPRQGKALPDYLAQAVRVLSVPPVMVAGAAVCTVAMAVSLLIFH